MLTEMMMEDQSCVELRAAVEKVPALQAKLGERSTVLQTVVMESLQKPGHYVCMANTHLYFHPQAGHVRLLQGATSLRHIQLVCQPYQQQVCLSVHLFWCWIQRHK
jgi:2',5'-phosphodiesterase